MAVKSLLITAFAALVVAVPQHAEHIGKAQVARSNELFSRGDLAGRTTISYDGSCGSWSGFTCGDGNCCSSQGWCGATSAHCGTGCQVGFGQCGAREAQSPVAVSSSVVPAPVAMSTTSTTTSSTASTSTSTSTTSTSITKSTTSTSTTTSTTSTFVEATFSDLPAVQTKEAEHKPSKPQPTTTTQPVPETTSSSSNPSSSNPSSSSSGLGDSYTMYMGDGSMTSKWPSQAEWVDFDTAFENNRALMSQSCTQFGAANNDNEEINSLKSALQSVASSSGVDSRFLLAIMLQESGGCVRAPTSNYGVRNPGLFQSHDGSGTCNDSGNMQNPCPSTEITQMVTDGADGTSEGDGLKQTIAEAGTSDVSKYYKASRIYNSGSISSSGQLQDGIATHCYSSDIANRLTGWVHAAHGCTLG